MVRKFRAGVAVMEVAQLDVRAQSGAEAMATATATLAKKRKLNDQDLTLSSSYVHLRSSKITKGNTRSKAPSESGRSTRNLDHDHVSTSCCSSNGSSEEANERTNFVDLEDEIVEVETSTYYSCTKRRETTPSSELQAESEGMDSTAKPSSEANSRHRSTVEKTPVELEIDEILAEAEKKILKQYSEKYNFDFVNEKPMEGRYEWVRLKP